MKYVGTVIKLGTQLGVEHKGDRFLKLETVELLKPGQRIQYEIDKTLPVVTNFEVVEDEL